ncbi:MAG: preprotein translocase subunit SecE [Inquilinus limosus]|jgi:preprotein translocase subunit SecE|uniref:Protein translocase subunit SecE n=1 Tax=Inquilinus limosus TaxID=171674 RepID=A0A952FGG0_9PROT|nr:preprotein translocase subunit SecE [Inquilinus limosus]
MAKTSPVQFFRQVRQETTKVTWPTRKETAITTGMVFVFVILMSVFFLAVDWAAGWAVTSVIGMGG